MTIEHHKKIEDIEAGIHADFANKYIGGGVLRTGCVQEEIMFVVQPEYLVSLLFCERMDNTEAIAIIGGEAFTK